MARNKNNTSVKLENAPAQHEQSGVFFLGKTASTYTVVFKPPRNLAEENIVDSTDRQVIGSSKHNNVELVYFKHESFGSSVMPADEAFENFGYRLAEQMPHRDFRPGLVVINRAVHDE